LVLALHAAAHGKETKQPLEDLVRALDMLPIDTWRSAAALAACVDATGAFATGLRLLPAGRDLTEQLGLTHTREVEVEMAARTVPYSAWFVVRLARTPGLRGKLALIASKLAPPPEWMRTQHPVARHGRLGLIAAYLVARPARLLWRAGPAIAAWWRARRAVR